MTDDAVPEAYLLPFEDRMTWSALLALSHRRRVTRPSGSGDSRGQYLCPFEGGDPKQIRAQPLCQRTMVQYLEIPSWPGTPGPIIPPKVAWEKLAEATSQLYG